ncbi:MAG: prolipoprotein diacylglyceryl transferase [Actinomycetota bacterium]
MAQLVAVVGSIPSPPSSQLDIGPLSFNYYGLCIGIGVLLAVVIGQRRWAARGGNPEDVAAVATWAVPAGLIGARLYHVITDWRPIEDWLKIWEGGLGIPGGLIAGIGVGVWVARRRGMDLGEAIDALIPGIPVAQAVGRFGNWFNQEIFGGPSDLPWAVEIDPEHRPAEFADQATFHPAFLYEGLWNLALAAFLVWIDRRGMLRRGMILPLYVLGYGIGRFLVETIRTDPATLILGIRVNHWVSGGAVLVSIVALLWLARRAAPSYYADGGPADIDRSDGDDGDAASDRDGGDTEESVSAG